MKTAFVLVVIALGAWWYLASARKTYRYMTKVDSRGRAGIQKEIFFELDAQKHPRLHKINRGSFLVFMVSLGPFRWIVYHAINLAIAVVIFPFFLAQMFWEFMTDFVSNAVSALRQPCASLTSASSKISSSN